MNTLKQQQIFLFFFSLFLIPLFAQKKSDAYQYIENYGLTAINTMHETKIPASIIMAVAMEESALGKSEVARNANNHFGMKSGANATEKKYKTSNGGYFRSYETAKISYEAFGNLLVSNPNLYGFLFKYSKTDYKSWAAGLSRSPYIKDPSFAKRLTDIIEAHDLYNFDNCIWEFK
jgi:flagellum-specific peptidoglycan hydrolase FlgJ